MNFERPSGSASALHAVDGMHLLVFIVVVFFLLLFLFLLLLFGVLLAAFYKRIRVSSTVIRVINAFFFSPIATSFMS